MYKFKSSVCFIVNFNRQGDIKVPFYQNLSWKELKTAVYGYCFKINKNLPGKHWFLRTEKTLLSDL